MKRKKSVFDGMKERKALQQQMGVVMKRETKADLFKAI